MNRLSAKFRITIGLTCLVASVLFVAVSVGMVPDERAMIMKGRAKLCETIAVNSSVLVSMDDIKRLRTILKAVVQRNGDILSAAVRQSSGDVVIEIGDHVSRWHGAESKAAVDSYVEVPIWADDRKWGNVEVRFQPLSAAGVLGFALDPVLRLVVTVSATCGVLFLFFLGKVLQHLDPSKVVPSRVRSALDTLSEGLLVINKDGRIALANQAFGSTVDMDPQDLQGRRAAEILSRSNGNLKLPDQLPWTKALEEETSHAGTMLTLRTPKAGERIFMVSASPIYGNKGEVRGAIASFEDVTQLEKNKLQLRESAEAAERANRAKSEFLARMSHEIRTPMNAILGYCDVLLRGMERDEKERQEHLATIQGSGNHLLELINDILDLSKIEAGKLTLDIQRCSVLEAISDVLSLVRFRAHEKGITLRSRTEGKIPGSILTDEGRLRQVLTNLVGNAVKFTEAGTIEIVARLVRVNGKPKLALDVSDSGIGMSPEKIETVFDPFVQADSSVTRRFGGTGLGLTISREFARALGGDVAATSEEGRGSVFTVTIDTGPLNGVPLIDVEDTSLLPQGEQKSRELEQLAPIKVLVVDDGEANRRLIELVLTRAGAIVETAENGRQALDLARSHAFDGVLLDMQMPVMDGYTAARSMRESGITIPIIALTAHAMSDDEGRCREAGCSGFLTKPVDMDVLLSVVAREIEGRVDAGDTSRTTAAGSSPAGGSSDAEASCIESMLPADDPALAEIIAAFVVRLHERVEAMAEAWERRDLAKLAKLSHWLKGSAGTAGFDVFTVPAAELERLATEGAIDRIPAVIEVVRTLDRRVVAPGTLQQEGAGGSTGNLVAG